MLNIKQYQRPTRVKTNRSPEHYADLKSYYERRTIFDLSEYRMASDAMKGEISIKGIGGNLRRVHVYSIRENSLIQAFYRDNSIIDKEIFEHTVPCIDLVHMTLKKYITIQQAFIPVITLLSKENDLLLEQSNKTRKQNSEPYYPFRRYIEAGIDISNIVDLNGNPISADYTIEDHYAYVSALHI
jgi:hypothetical protein